MDDSEVGVPKTTGNTSYRYRQWRAKSWPAIPAAGDHVLSVTGGRKPIIINTKIRDRMTAATGGDDWRIHDLRRTCATQWPSWGCSRTSLRLP